MTSGPTTAERPPPASAGPGSTPVPLYRRRSTLLALAVVAVVAAAVISDLPAPASRSAEISAATTVIGEINTDVAPCVFARA